MIQTDILAYIRGAQPFWSKGRSIFLVHSAAEDKIMSWTFKESSIKSKYFFI